MRFFLSELVQLNRLKPCVFYFLLTFHRFKIRFFSVLNTAEYIYGGLDFFTFAYHASNILSAMLRRLVLYFYLFCVLSVFCYYSRNI